jgi:hypothetical protein
MDNTVSSLSQEVAFHEKVALIRNYFKADNGKNVVNGNLTPQLQKMCVYEILFSSMDSKNTQSRINQNSPVVRSCNIPDQFWDVTLACLKNNYLNQSLLRQITWSSLEDFYEELGYLLRSCLLRGKQRHLI